MKHVWQTGPVYLALILLVTVGCRTAPGTEMDREHLVQRADATVQMFQETDPSLAESFFDKSAGYAVFPRIGKGAAGIGGAYGRGVLYENGEAVGFCDVTQGTIGFQLGGQAYSQLIFFENDIVLEDFKAGRVAFAAQATAVAAASGAGANARYDHGVAVFTRGEKGLMYEASIGGQGFSYVPK